MKRKLFIVIGLVTVTGLSAAAMYARRGVAAPAVATDVVSRGDIRTVVTANGSIEAVDTVQVGTQVSGTIQSLGKTLFGQKFVRLRPLLSNLALARICLRVPARSSGGGNRQAVSSQALAQHVG